MSKKKPSWGNERLTVRSKSGKKLAEWTKGSSGRTEKFNFPLEPGGKSSIFSSGKRTYHKSGKTHGHGLFAKGGKKKSWLGNWK